MLKEPETKTRAPIQDGQAFSGIFPAQVDLEEPENFSPERQWLSLRLVGSVYVLFALMEALIWLRVILKLMAANPANSFVKLIYQLSAIPVWPFSGLVDNPTGGGMVVEITSFIGMITYCLLCWSIIQYLHRAKSRREVRDLPEI